MESGLASWVALPPEGLEVNRVDHDVVLGRVSMQDIIFVAITIAFFALSIGYVRFCDRVK